MQTAASARITCHLLLTLLLSGCASVPFDYPRESSVAFVDVGDTQLGTYARDWSARHDGQSGFYPLVYGTDALGVRLRLVEAAERSIDVQYFLMKDDQAGRLFSAALLAAADRGVRIRFLLDDIFTTVGDQKLANLDRHENIEVRLYNPIARGGIGALNFTAEFKRANRRMHNKSLTADNSVTVVGGRNIADEYFELQTDVEFLDFDVLGIGSVAADVSNTFDAFWNHHRTVPMAAFGNDIDDEAFAKWRAELDEAFGAAGNSVYAKAMTATLVADLFAERVEAYPADFEVVTDDPEKLVSEISEDQQVLVNYLVEVAERAQTEVVVITPYFVPMEAGIRFWQSLVDRGIRVVVLTNSLASNNHTAVHSGYAGRREAILEAGVELYEARVDAVGAQEDGEAGAPGVLTMHTKAVVIDRALLFAGSLNLDPRSIELNSEMGILIDSEEMVGPLVTTFLDDLPANAYRVERDERGQLTWRGTVDGREVVESKEPQSSGWLRFKAFLLKVVPDSQL